MFFMSRSSMCISALLLSSIAQVSFAGSKTQDSSLIELSKSQQGYEIAKVLDSRDQGYVSSQVDLVMILKNARGQESKRELSMRFLEQNNAGDKSLVELTFPANVRGIKLLTHPQEGLDNQWLYLPTQKRTKRIAARSKTGAFMGSEFSFEDLADKAVDEFSYNYISQESCPSEASKKLDCHVLERIPNDDYSAYSRQVLWIETHHYQIHKIEYFDRKDKLLKVFTAKDFSLFEDKYWRPQQVEMINTQTKNSTVLTYNEFNFNANLKESDFLRNALDEVSH